VRSYLAAIALTVAACTPALAADCAIDQVGDRANAQVEITLGNVSSPTRVWVYSGSGAPMLRYTTPNVIDALPAFSGTSTATAGFHACSNVMAIFDAMAEAQRNFNQCSGVQRTGTFSGQDRAIDCDDPAD